MVFRGQPAQNQPPQNSFSKSAIAQLATKRMELFRNEIESLHQPASFAALLIAWACIDYFSSARAIRHYALVVRARRQRENGILLLRRREEGELFLDPHLPIVRDGGPHHPRASEAAHHGPAAHPPAGAHERDAQVAVDREQLVNQHVNPTCRNDRRGGSRRRMQDD